MPWPVRRRAGRCHNRLGLGLVLAALQPAGAARAAEGTSAAAFDDASQLLQTGLVADHEGRAESEAYFDEDFSQHLQEVSQHLDALAEHLDNDTFSQALSVSPDAPQPRQSDPSLPPQQRAFQRFDADGSGGYNRAELAQFLRASRRNTSEDGISQLWKRADMDGNSEIDIDELLDCVVNPASCYHAERPPVGAAALDRRIMRASPRLSQGARGRRGRRWRQSWARSLQQAQKRMEDIDTRHELTKEEAMEKVASQTTLLQLHLMPDKGLNSSYGAVCLDGSDAGFYLAPAADGQHSGRWIIMIEGGGWCGDVDDCRVRSYTNKGSSKKWLSEVHHGGIMSNNCQANPHFCTYNRVAVAYCDGASLTGNRDEPIITKTAAGLDRPLYFRGKRILDAVLDTLLAKHSLDRAEQVLLAGCSAGGLSTLVHADHVNKRLQAGAPMLTKFRALPLSGFFLKHNSVENQAAYPSFLYRVVKLANSTASLNKRCLGAMSQGKHWNCIFPEFSLNYTETPVFLVNSAMDWWSGLCVLYPDATTKKVAIAQGAACGRSNRKAHYSCGYNIERCTPFEMFAMNQFIRDFSSTLASSSSYGKAGNGAFIHSCHTHCEALEDSWTRIAIGGTTMHQAVLSWWRSDGAPAAAHLHKPCEYSQGGALGDEWPYQCNPTCVALPS